MLADRALDLLSAALRHVRDAETLATSAGDARSLDQAFHLAGYGPECARKATLSKKLYDAAIGHGVSEASEHALRVALATDPVARRYDLQHWSSKYPALRTWKEDVRYEPTGRRGEAEVQALLREARDIVDRIAYALWADGRVGADFAW